MVDTSARKHLSNEGCFLFPPFRLDPLNAQLWRGNQEISLRRKTFDVLRYLVDHPGQLVTKAALLDAVWPGVTVSDSMPAICVAELRKALGDEGKTPAIYRDRAWPRLPLYCEGYDVAAAARGGAQTATLSRRVPSR